MDGVAEGAAEGTAVSRGAYPVGEGVGVGSLQAAGIAASRIPAKAATNQGAERRRWVKRPPSAQERVLNLPLQAC